MPKHPPRVAIVGFVLESNRFAPLSVREDFEKSCSVESIRLLHLTCNPVQLEIRYDQNLRNIA